MLTVTAPGGDVLPWDTSKCLHGINERCSGRRGCVLDEEALTRWRVDLEDRWKRYTMAARARVRRELKDKAATVMLAGAWELQKRGAPHVHIVVPAGRVGQAFADALALLAAQYGFGFVDTRLKTVHALAAANYLSKYLTAGERKHHRPTRSVYASNLPKRIAWVNRRLTQKSFATMRMCRLIRKRWAFAQGFCSYPRTANERERDAMIGYFLSARRRAMEKSFSVPLDNSAVAV